MVNANKTSLVGVRVEVVPECVCGARNFAKVGKPFFKNNVVFYYALGKLGFRTAQNSSR